jgi:hypothetical protein
MENFEAPRATTEPTLTESQQRFMAMGRSAGPEDPIYSGGLRMTSVRALPQSTPTSQPATAGTNQAPPDDLMPVGQMQTAMDEVAYKTGAARRPTELQRKAPPK